MTPTIILVSVLGVIFVAVVLSLFAKISNASDKNVKNQIKALEQKLILESQLE